MNVIVANKFEKILDSLEIEVIKKLTGEYAVDEFISTFENFYFQRMILDVTAIKDYKNIENLQKISMKLDASKIILLLDGTPESTRKEYLSQIISMGIYNFTTNKDGILYLLSHPNEYRDVAHLHQLTGATPEPIVRTQIVTKESAPKVITNTVVQNEVVFQKDKVIGVINATEHAGASTLIYMMLKQLEGKCTAGAIEVGSFDFPYFNMPNMISTTKEDFGTKLLQLTNNDVVFMELKDTELASNCTDVLYLLEPSIIKLNKIMKKDRKLFEKLRGEKVVLNRSMISSKDLMDFEYETKLKIFHSVPCLNDRKTDNIPIDELLQKLGVI